MRLSEAFPSKWLAAADLPDEGLQVTIDSWEVEEIGQGNRKEKKPVLSFRERDVKSLVLNITNGKIIEQITGTDDFDAWVGHKITLVPKEVEFQGDTVWAIRVQLPRRQQANRAATQAQAPATVGRALPSDGSGPPLTDDDIPF